MEQKEGPHKIILALLRGFFVVFVSPMKIPFPHVCRGDRQVARPPHRRRCAGDLPVAPTWIFTRSGEPQDDGSLVVSASKRQSTQNTEEPQLVAKEATVN